MNVRRKAVAGLALVSALVGPRSLGAAQSDDLSRTIEAVRAGGVVVVCRHAMTGSFRESEPVDYADPSTQRRLSREGERQAEAMGRAIRALGIELAEVVASPMDRARRTAELMFGPDVSIDSVWHTNGGSYGGPPRDRREEILSRPLERGVRFIVSHIGTMGSVLPDLPDVAEGDCVVVRPGGGSYEVVGVVPWRAWAGHHERGRSRYHVGGNAGELRHGEPIERTGRPTDARGPHADAGSDGPGDRPARRRR